MSTTYKTWGTEFIDENSHKQMQAACDLPVAVAGALMPDAHLGYGLPIGGVLALKDAICPYAVGVDIACRMKLSIFPLPAEYLENNERRFAGVLQDNTYFGVGVEHKGNNSHNVMALDWSAEAVTRANKDRAFKQLGTSGSGNHFVEFGILTIGEDRIHRVGQPYNTILQQQVGPGQYVALMSHSGSRGTGAAVCNEYSKLAKALHPEYGDLGWLSLDSQAGQDYWYAMNLMGEYAAANHDVIHREIALSVGQDPIFQISNHHNFAWKEVHGGREVIVHRKGATPAGNGVLGIIPGSMGTPAYIVSGLGNPDSLCSASHGAGRVMSRKQAKKTFNYRDEIAKLAARGITVLSAGADEVCGVYKDIHAVMGAQDDLVQPLAMFHPKIVRMCGSNDRAED